MGGCNDLDERQLKWCPAERHRDPPAVRQAKQLHAADGELGDGGALAWERQW